MTGVNEREDDFFELMSDVKARSEVNGSANEDRVPSSTRIWGAERERKEQILLFLPLPLVPLACSGDIAIAYIEGIVIYSSAARDYKPAAVPLDAAQEARYPAGTLGDIPAR